MHSALRTNTGTSAGNTGVFRSTLVWGWVKLDRYVTASHANPVTLLQLVTVANPWIQLKNLLVRNLVAASNGRGGVTRPNVVPCMAETAVNGGVLSAIRLRAGSDNCNLSLGLGLSFCDIVVLAIVVVVLVVAVLMVVVLMVVVFVVVVMLLGGFTPRLLRGLVAAGARVMMEMSSITLLQVVIRLS